MTSFATDRDSQAITPNNLVTETEKYLIQAEE